MVFAERAFETRYEEQQRRTMLPWIVFGTASFVIGIFRESAKEHQACSRRKHPPAYVKQRQGAESWFRLVRASYLAAHPFSSGACPTRLSLLLPLPKLKVTKGEGSAAARYAAASCSAIGRQGNL